MITEAKDSKGPEQKVKFTSQLLLCNYNSLNESKIFLIFFKKLYIRF